MTYRDRYEATLRAMPGTIEQLSATLGVGVHSVERWVSVLRHAGWAHAGEWERSPSCGKFRPVIYGGPGPDAPKPRKLATLERLRKDPDLYAKHLARDRVRKVVAKILTSGKKATPFDALGL